ncbi:hypothetical protein F4808DRAFT_416395 [Astrocystis sublimbata]|nr:hypothetical protein F4808DRAFT_416395 [Astrocystis sublimbata]
MSDILPSGNPDNPGVSGDRRQGGAMADEISSTVRPIPDPSNTAAFQDHNQEAYDPSSNPFSGQLETASTQGSNRQGPYDMSVITTALPQNGYRSVYTSGQHQRYSPSGPNMLPHHLLQYPNQPQVFQHTNQQYFYPHNQFYSQHVQPALHQHQQASLGSQRDTLGNGYYTNPVMMNQMPAPVPGAYYFPHSSQYSAQNLPMHNSMAQPQYLVPNGSSGGLDGSNLPQGNNTMTDLNGARSNTVRGPPRKPRQTGHAIWIGNLPPQTPLMDLVHHVYATAPGMESLFLISKSNCAFANFQAEPTCVTAQQKLHESKFQSVRLVSRLRKSTVEGSSGQTAPTGPASTTSPSPQNLSLDQASPTPPDTPANPSLTQDDENVTSTKSGFGVEGAQEKDRFFILKSLTVEDLELSTQNGVWATQSHNESGLNDAFQNSSNVYLIFSANKSGEYFGYARMSSHINHDPAAAIEFAPKAQATSDSNLPKAIPTEATDTCPRGRIIDDSARGTIFWEIERDEVDGTSDAKSENSETTGSVHDVDGGSKAWGKPFELEWLSTTRLPFYKARGLRNPWNSNRDVKIARDGTELEPTIGRKLIGLFNRVQSPVPMGMAGMAGMATGYPPQISSQFQ